MDRVIHIHTHIYPQINGLGVNPVQSNNPQQTDHTTTSKSFLNFLFY